MHWQSHSLCSPIGPVVLCPSVPLREETPMGEPPLRLSLQRCGECSRSAKTGHNKAGRSDFRNQQFEPDTGKKSPKRKQGSEEIPQSRMRTQKRKMRLTGFNVTGLR